MSLPGNLKRKLKARVEAGNHRALKLTSESVDFASNDYLGLARSQELQESIRNQLKGLPNGSTGSRLLSGNGKFIVETEHFLAEILSSENSLLFDSGYMANLAIFSAVPQKGDTVLYDELSHACIKDGIRLSLAHKFSFKHNNLKDLEKKLKKAQGVAYIAVESIYS
ncbi:MAG: aminotransferase class I/II-fold pyridoxal phosphate-dependent enzyme, partial [Bacteroidota bacterium]